MNVIYDVSAFGGALLWPHTRSGVLRVVENLADALIQSGECSLTFSASEEFLHYHAVRQSRLTPRYRDIPFSCSPIHYYLSSSFDDVNQRVRTESGFSKVTLRARRKALHLGKLLFNTSLLQRKVVYEKTFLGADIFHSPYWAIPSEARKHGNLRTFLTVHDLIPLLHPDFFDAPRPGTEHHLKPIIDGVQKSDWVTCVSQSTKNDLCNYRKDLDPARVSVMHLGASDWFRPCADAAKIESTRSKYKIPSGQYILSVCTLEPRKNLPHLIRCFLKLLRQERLAELHLVLVGSLGWKYDSILAELTATEKDLRDRIVLPGRVEDEDMAALYSGSLAFVYPSLYEGFGLPPLEAMQCGVPVITSNTSSLPEVVGDAGIMVDPTNADELCQAMLSLAKDGALHKTMAQKSLERSKQFSWAKCADRVISAYKVARDSA